MRLWGTGDCHNVTQDAHPLGASGAGAAEWPALPHAVPARSGGPAPLGGFVPCAPLVGNPLGAVRTGFADRQCVLKHQGLIPKAPPWCGSSGLDLGRARPVLNLKKAPPEVLWLMVLPHLCGVRSLVLHLAILMAKAGVASVGIRNGFSTVRLTLAVSVVAGHLLYRRAPPPRASAHTRAETIRPAASASLPSKALQRWLACGSAHRKPSTGNARWWGLVVLAWPAARANWFDALGCWMASARKRPGSRWQAHARLKPYSTLRPGSDLRAHGFVSAWCWLGPLAPQTRQSRPACLTSEGEDITIVALAACLPLAACWPAAPCPSSSPLGRPRFRPASVAPSY